jgi:hypothetical protein
VCHQIMEYKDQAGKFRDRVVQGMKDGLLM